jgi:hypothetical protein
MATFLAWTGAEKRFSASLFDLNCITYYNNEKLVSSITTAFTNFRGLFPTVSPLKNANNRAN